MHILQFLGALAKLLKATASSRLSGSLSDRIEQPATHWTDIYEIYLSILQKSVDKIQVSLKSVKNSG